MAVAVGGALSRAHPSLTRPMVTVLSTRWAGLGAAVGGLRWIAVLVRTATKPADAERGKGSTFTFALPAGDTSPASDEFGARPSGASPH